MALRPLERSRSPLLFRFDRLGRRPGPCLHRAQEEIRHVVAEADDRRVIVPARLRRLAARPIRAWRPLGGTRRTRRRVALSIGRDPFAWRALGMVVARFWSDVRHAPWDARPPRRALAAGIAFEPRHVRRLGVARDWAPRLPRRAAIARRPASRSCARSASRSRPPPSDRCVRRWSAPGPTCRRVRCGRCDGRNPRRDGARHN